MQYWGMTLMPKPQKLNIQFKQKNKNYEWHERGPVRVNSDGRHCPEVAT